MGLWTDISGGREEGEGAKPEKTNGTGTAMGRGTDRQPEEQARLGTRAQRPQS